MGNSYRLHQGITFLLSHLCHVLYKHSIIPDYFLEKNRIIKSDEIIYVPFPLLCLLHSGIMAFQTSAVFQPYYLNQKNHTLHKSETLFYDISLFLLKKATYILPADITYSLFSKPVLCHHIVYDPIQTPFIPLGTTSVTDFFQHPTLPPPILLGKFSENHIVKLKTLYPNNILKIIAPIFLGKMPQELWQSALYTLSDTMLAGIWSLQLPFLIEAFSKGLCPISFCYHLMTHPNPQYVVQMASVLLSLPIQHPSELKQYDLDYIKPKTHILYGTLPLNDNSSYDILSFLLQQE